MSTKKSKVSGFRIKHDRNCNMGLKHPERFKHFLRFALKDTNKFDALDFSRFEFVETEFLNQKLGGRIEESRADVIAKIGLKGMDTEASVAVIAEHKSFRQSQKEIFLNALKYNVALLESGIYPLMTILLLHNDASSIISPDLQGAFDCTAQMKKIFGHLGLNFTIIVLDLNKISEDEIKKGAGSIAALCYALKSSNL